MFCVIVFCVAQCGPGGTRKARRRRGAHLFSQNETQTCVQLALLAPAVWGGGDHTGALALNLR